MKIKFERNTLSTSETTTQELWINAYEFGANFAMKRIPSFVHYGTNEVKCKNYKILSSIAFTHQSSERVEAGLSVLIPEWVDESRWLFIFRLCQIAESIEIDNLRVSKFSEWLKGDVITDASDCYVILNGANVGRTLNTLFEQSQLV